MLIHFVPRYFIRSSFEREVKLIDFHCPELGLKLFGGKDLVERRPYPNKSYLVACRKIGQKAIDGFLVEVDDDLNEFLAITRWQINDEQIVEHIVKYTVLDDEFDAVTGNMVLWNAMSPSLGGFSDRCPTEAKNWRPALAQPCMSVIPSKREGHVMDSINHDGKIIKRVEACSLHTVERERLQNPFFIKNDRMPEIETAFLVTM